MQFKKYTQGNLDLSIQQVPTADEIKKVYTCLI